MNPVVVTLKPGEILFREGDTSNGVYIVRQGELEILREKEGTTVTLAKMHAGDVIGTSTIFSREGRTATVRAHTAVQVVHVSSETVEVHFKNLPVWVQAVLKDSIGRLKTANDQLVEAKVNEKKLLNRVGTRFHLASQFCAFLGFAVRTGLIKDEGLELFPLNGVLERCESILQHRVNFFEQLLDAFVKGSLLKIQVDKKWGRAILFPRASLLEDYANFVVQSARTGVAGFVPIKYQPLLSAFVRLSKKPDAKEFYSKSQIIEMVSKESGNKISEHILSELLEFRILSSQPSEDKFSWNAQQIQKRLIFESSTRFVKDLEDGEKEHKVA